ncbi:MAG TPA: ABC transporter ATP-binding protein [Terriglobales bacterium]|nr:ABC transporter ATP-binding protein [Terriglobales bacterium]
MPKAANPDPFPSTLWRLWDQCRPYRLHLAGSVALAFLSTPFALLVPLPLKLVVDNVLTHQPAPAWLERYLPNAWLRSNTNLLASAISFLLLLGLVMQLQVLASWMLQTYTGEKLVHDFRARLFWHVQRLRLSFYDRSGTADVAYRIQHDAPAIQTAIVQGILPFVTAVFSFAGVAWVTCKMDLPLALIALSVSPALVYLSRSASLKVHDGWHRVKELDSSAMSVLTEVLSAVRLVKAFGRESDEDERFATRSSQRVDGQMRLALTQAVYYCLTALLITFGTAAALWVGTRHVQAGLLSVGDLLVVMAYMTQLYEPLRTMSNKIPEVQASLVSLERAFALLDEVPETLSSAGRPIHRVSGRIEFQNVAFAYHNQRRVLDHISFEIEPGTKVGVLGPTGSGKSTLLSLLTRFYEPAEGSILLDGIDIRELRLRDLRDQFGIVPQDPVLFNCSIAENIAFSTPDVSQETIVAAAVAAHADQFIQLLPEGYETQVGDRGCCLSGGERQRIAIARAFLKNAPILILDEPTSAVDSKTEAAVISALDALLRGRTSFMIAHRLSTLERCDLLLHFDSGEIKVISDDVKMYLRRLARAQGFHFEEPPPARLRPDIFIAAPSDSSTAFAD